MKINNNIIALIQVIFR